HTVLPLDRATTTLPYTTLFRSAALEGALGTKEKTRKNIYLGALYRLMNTSGWKTNAQLAQMIPPETEWEAKELMLEYIRHHKDPDRKSTRLNSSHQIISYAVFC